MLLEMFQQEKTLKLILVFVKYPFGMSKSDTIVVTSMHLFISFILNNLVKAQNGINYEIQIVSNLLRQMNSLRVKSIQQLSV